MPTTTPSMAVDPPVGWVATSDILPPKIAESSGTVLTEFRVFHSVSSSEGAAAAALVVGCVATPIPGWVEDMRPSVEARTNALAGASAERITGYPMDARRDSKDPREQAEQVLVLRAASDLVGLRSGIARTFIGFDESRVFTCFATCASRRNINGAGDATTPSSPSFGCEHSVIEARLEASSPPPKPSIALSGVTWAVHHPQPTAMGVVITIAVLGVLAVVLRRRPKSRI